MSFSDQIAAFNAKATKAATMVYRGTSFDLFSHIVKRTPVKTGRLRGNWQVGINTRVDGETNNSASQALSQGSRKINNAEIGQNIYITNNLPYAMAVENGSSQQAPSGMVRVTITEFQDLVKARARKNKV